MLGVPRHHGRHRADRVGLFELSERGGAGVDQRLLVSDRRSQAGVVAGVQDRERGLRQAVAVADRLGLAIPEAVGDRDGLPEAALAVLDARGSAGLRAAIAYEQTLIDACAAALGKLEEPNAIRTVATVMAGHAQHQALLRQEAGIDPLSSAA